MDISKDRFAGEVMRIIQDIAESHFVAFDLELSGVAGRSARLTPGKPSLQEYYEELKEAAEKYQILQFGLTVVQEDVQEGQYIVKPYNFNISQIPALHERNFKRTWSMNSGAISFLLKNGFDFGKQMTQGIHFLSRSEEQVVRNHINEAQNVKRPDMVLKPEDDALVDHIRVSVKRWMETPPETREAFLNIPANERAKRVPGVLNRYQIRLTHQIVQNEFTGLKAQSMNHFVQITNPSLESLNETRRLEEEFVKREISRAVGFRWILEALAGNNIEDLPMEYVLQALPFTRHSERQGERSKQFLEDLNRKLSNRRRVFVGHNCFTDLVNLQKFMIGTLPEKVEDFAKSMNDVFPAIVDTKHIASFGNARWGDTSLAKVEEDLKIETTPKIVLAAKFDRYRFANVEHEAGYDSLLTANVAIRASAKMQREGTYREQITSPDPTDGSSRAFGLGIDQDLALIESAAKESINTGTLDTNSKPFGVPIMEKTAAPSSAEVVAVKEVSRAMKGATTPTEIAKVKGAFAKATIYDVLDDHQNGQDMPGEDIAENSRGQNGEALAIASRKDNQVAKAKAGDIMPRWDDDFWSIFGNRLQVNGCKEGVCRL